MPSFKYVGTACHGEFCAATERGTFPTRTRGADACSLRALPPAAPYGVDSSWEGARHFRMRTDLSPTHTQQPGGVGLPSLSSPADSRNYERAAAGRLEMLDYADALSPRGARELPAWWAGGAPANRSLKLQEGPTVTTSHRSPAAEHYRMSPRQVVEHFVPEEAKGPLSPSPGSKVSCPPISTRPESGS